MSLDRHFYAHEPMKTYFFLKVPIIRSDFRVIKRLYGLKNVIIALYLISIKLMLCRNTVFYFSILLLEKQDKCNLEKAVIIPCLIVLIIIGNNNNLI